MAEHRTRGRKVASSNPGRNGGKIFFSRINFVCWLLFGVRWTTVLPQWHVKDPGHSAQSAGGGLHLKTHTLSTQRSRSGLTMPLSRHIVGTYQETSTHATRQRNTPLQSSQPADSLWTDPGLKSEISVRKLISISLSLPIYPLTARIVGAPQLISQPVSSIFPCPPLPSETWQTPFLSIPWCCLPTSSSVCLVFFPLSLCFARWFWPDLMNLTHDHTNFHLKKKKKKCERGMNGRTIS